jgi:hypothetical protein
MDNNRKHNPDDVEHQGAKEGDYKNIETAVNNPSYFDDSYASQQADEIAEEGLKAKQEQEGKHGRRGNH